MKNEGFTRIYLPPGNYTLNVKKSFYYNGYEAKYSFTIPANVRESFIRVPVPDPSLEDFVQFIVNTTFLLTHIGFPIEDLGNYDFEVDFIEEKHGLQEIRNCKYLPPDKNFIM